MANHFNPYFNTQFLWHSGDDYNLFSAAKLVITSESRAALSFAQKHPWERKQLKGKSLAKGAMMLSG